MEFILRWESPYARHRERFFFPKINFWRDFFPGDFETRLSEMEEGEEQSEAFATGVLVPPYDDKNVITIRESQLNLQSLPGHSIELFSGRFYPRGIVMSPYTFPEETRPCRYLGEKASMLTIDLNHPLAGVPLTLTGRILKHLNAREERGGTSNDIAYTITDNGPGLEASRPDMETDFFHETPFHRQDESEDRRFYQKPRLVNHVDETALSMISSIYRRFLKPGMRVLDLMSSWTSHLPIDVENLAVSGLGLNREELESNKDLDGFVIHDINRDPILPFKDGEFDAVLCTVSVEYLIDPLAVFKEIARLLKPGAPFVVTFSNRWFPPKVTTQWTHLHEFERPGFVLECYRRSGAFSNLHSESIRGFPRAAGDKYYPLVELSDPVYAVWGTRHS
jgi:SAM-dependent methyltransferase